ncbi:MAG: AEC family transporter [Pseudomonadota bacterium]
MLGVLSTTGSIFALIVLGYVSVLIGVFTKAHLRLFGRYVINFALPALIFRAVTASELAEVIDPGYLVIYLLASMSAFCIGFLVSWRILGLTALASTFQGMGMSCSNTGFVGYPLLLMTLPAVAPTVLALNMTIENLIMLPIVLILAELSTGKGRNRWILARDVFGRMLTRNPIVVALIVGLFFSILRVPLPVIVTRPIEIVADSSAAVSLMVIGGTLVGLPLKSIDARVLLVVGGKLFLFPALVFVSLLVFAQIGFRPGSTELWQALVISAALPAPGIYPIVAQRYGEESNAALAMLLMVAISFFTLTFVLMAFGLGASGGF